METSMMHNSGMLIQFNSFFILLLFLKLIKEQIVIQVQTQLIEAENKFIESTRTKESVREENTEIKVMGSESIIDTINQSVKKGPLITVEGD